MIIITSSYESLFGLNLGLSLVLFLYIILNSLLVVSVTEGDSILFTFSLLFHVGQESVMSILATP